MLKKSTKIYVAGHTGLLGSAITRVLAEKGYQNVTVRTHEELDLTDNRAVNDFFSQTNPEVVFMTAGKAGNLNQCISNPASLYSLNSIIQNNIFAAACGQQVKNLVYFASSCIYPNEVQQPIKEEYFLTGPLEKATEGYAAAKLSGVLACKSYNNEFFDGSCRFIAVVPNTLYGPNDHYNLNDSHVFSALIMRFHEAVANDIKEVTLWGSGKPRREFIFSEDVADAAIFLVNNAEKLNNIHYNTGTGIDLSIRELAEMVAEETGFKGRIKWDTTKPDGRLKKLLDSSKIKQLGWKSKIEIQEGLKKTYRWYQQHLIG